MPKGVVHLCLVSVDRSNVESCVPDRLLELVADVLLVAEDDAARLGRDVLLDHGHEEVAFGALIGHLKQGRDGFMYGSYELEGLRVFMGLNKRRMTRAVVIFIIMHGLPT